MLLGVDEDEPTPEASTGFTAFNMKEELEEGHFDKDGHYLWNKEAEIRDNWLDNINWVQVCFTSVNINIFLFTLHRSRGPISLTDQASS